MPAQLLSGRCKRHTPNPQALAVCLLAFGGFLAMAAVLIAADLVLYLLMKLGVFKAPRDRAT